VSAFREAVGRHLLAIEERDLEALEATLAPDTVLLVASDGRLTRTAREFLEGYRAWFAMKHWRLDVKPIQMWESAELGVALLNYAYREMAPGQVPTLQLSVVSLVFQNRNGQWRMIQNQNTPLQK
jgi:ketosteroid isomerase-like protein